MNQLRIDSGHWNFTDGLKRTAPVFTLGVLFERSVSLLFTHPLLALGGLGITYYYRSTLKNEIELIKEESDRASRLNNIARFTFPLLCVTTPLLALKATSTGENVTYLMITTLFTTAVSAISPIASRHAEKISDYFLNQMGMHASNLAALDCYRDIEQIRANVRENYVGNYRELTSQIKELEEELKQHGVYVSGDSVITITEIEEEA